MRLPSDCLRFNFQNNFWHSEDYLSRIVRELHSGETQKQSYYAASHASACVRQANTFLSNATQVDASLQGLLYYYGLLNWYKALIHVFDLEYPATTSVLQHGVSVRRTKRASYHLLTETLYVYKEGVIQSAAAMAGLSLPQRIAFGDAIGFSPGLREVVDALYPASQHVYPVVSAELLGEGIAGRGAREGDAVDAGADSGHTGSYPTRWFVPRISASQRGLTVDEWISEFLQAEHTSDLVSLKSAHGSLNQAAETPSDTPKGWLELPHLSDSHPWLVKGCDHGTITSIEGHRAARTAQPVQGAQNGRSEVLLYNATPMQSWVCEFVILFCLASIVRYNPLEWSDIQRWHNETDALFIESYLKFCPDSVSRCVEDLYRDMLMFHHHDRASQKGALS